MKRIWLALCGCCSMALFSIALGGAALAQDAAPDSMPNGDGASDAANVQDGGVVDAAGQDAQAPGCDEVLGRPCTQAGNECGTASCLLVTQSLGVCTCSCTADDPSTPTVNEDDCPRKPGSTCGAVQMSSGWVENFCFQTCQPKLGGNDCDPAFSCSPRSAAFSGHWNKAICALPGCTSDDECPVTTQTKCDTAKAGQCAADETCVALLEGLTAGVCVKPGTCDVQSGLCGAHATKNPAANVGDPCQSDFECGAHMRCEQELDFTGLGLKDHGQPCSDDAECCGSCDVFGGGCSGSCAVRARSGYCLVTGCAFATATDYSEHACPAGSTCHRLFYGGICFKTCDPQNPATCRGESGDLYGDYECRSWDKIEIEAGQGYTDSPVCEFGDVITCNIFSGSSGLDCSSLAPQANPSDMACRMLDSTESVDPYSPAGFCFDSTGSGPVPTPPADAGVDGATGDGSMADGGPRDAVISRDVAYTPPDAGPLDTGSPERDEVPDVGTVDSGESSGGGGGCVVTGAGGARMSGSSVWLGLLLLALARSRRRRSR